MCRVSFPNPYCTQTHPRAKSLATLPKKIRILLIEDNRILREGIESLLNSQKDMKTIAAPQSINLKTRVRETKPHVLLTDLGVHNQAGREILELAVKDFPDVKTIGMGLSPQQTDVVEFVASGVSGFILKHASEKEFLETIRSVADGLKVLPSMLAAPFFAHIVEQAQLREKPSGSAVDRMTTREREVVALIREALSNKEIARKLNISTYTVKSHVHNILEKMALQSRMQIARHSLVQNGKS